MLAGSLSNLVFLVILLVTFPALSVCSKSFDGLDYNACSIQPSGDCLQIFFCKINFLGLKIVEGYI